MPFRPRLARSLTSVICALILLSSGDIEVTPGSCPAPPSQSFGSSQFISSGVLNTRSVVHKASSLHDIKNDFQLDVRALTKTWIDDDAPPAIKIDVAPEVFIVLHVHRAAVLGTFVHFNICQRTIQWRTLHLMTLTYHLRYTMWNFNISRTVRASANTWTDFK